MEDDIQSESNTPKCTTVFRELIRESWCFCLALIIFLLGGTILASTTPWIGAVAAGNPNLSDKLLAKNYSDVAFATTHNSFAIFGSVVQGNQFKSIEQSLELGVRALMLDVHFSDDTKTQVLLCHNDCGQGSVKVDTVFDTIATFIDKYPKNVISLLWQVECDGGEDGDDCLKLKQLLYTVVEQSRLADMLYTPKSHWETLGEMIGRNEKIVQFSESGPFGRPWDLNLWEYVVETPWDNPGQAGLDATCEFGRGASGSSNKMFLNNHFTALGSIPTPLITIGYNTNPYMYERVIRCQNELGKATTNFLAVDHWWYSGVIATVSCLNNEEDLQTCESVDTWRAISIAAISILGGAVAILAIYFIVRIYRKISNQTPTHPDKDALLGGVRIEPDDVQYNEYGEY
jgi:hypothetical protein